MSIPKIKRAEELEVGDVVEMYYWGWEKTNVAIEMIRKSKSGTHVEVDKQKVHTCYRQARASTLIDVVT